VSPHSGLKRRYWSVRSELAQLALWAVCWVPTALGERLRALVLPWFLKRLGARSVIQRGLRITNPERVSIGADCNFAQDVFIAGGGGVSIGDWVGLGPDVKVWSVNHRFDDPDRPWRLQGWELKPVVIEDDVWLGANVFVMPGVTIRRGAIVAAGSVVNKNVAPYALVAGNPVRLVGWRKRPVDSPGHDSAAGDGDAMDSRPRGSAEPREP
jgi:maltose O-acetyltransferase